MSTITKDKKFNFKIGADPEFSIILQNKRIDACATMSEILKNKKEFKGNPRDNMGFNVGKFGNIGWDGASQTGEVRPSPAHTPTEVVSNLANIFKAFVKYMSVFELTTLSQHASIGGHIHFEAKNEMTNQKAKILHAHMISFYTPILMSENKINLSLRIRQGYGSMTDFRYERKGTDDNGNTIKTYEFRVPSAEWLTSSKIANATMAYMGVIYNEIINHPKNLKKYKDIILKSDKQTEAFQALSLQNYNILNELILKKIRHYIKDFELYEPFKKEIDFILHPKEVIKEKIKFNYDINNGWNLNNNVKKITKREITSEKKFQEKIKDKDADTISKMMQIDYNEDAKINEFVNALALRTGAFNWKLKKQYFIFGLKRGINDIIVKNIKGQYLFGGEQINTEADLTLINRAFEKMTRRYLETNSIPNSMTIDFKSGKTISLRENLVFIGLPYEMRMKNQIKKFLDMIWNIENSKLEPHEINKLNLKTGIGEIEKIENERNEISPNPEEIIIDNGCSHSSRNQQNAIIGILNEQNNNENQETEYDNLDEDLEEEMNEIVPERILNTSNTCNPITPDTNIINNSI